MKWLLPSLCIVCFAVRGTADDVVLEAKGYVVAAHVVQVSPSVPGILTWMDPRLEEGQTFKEGDVLAKIDDREFRCDLDHAEQALRAVQARLKAMQSDGQDEIKQAEAELDEEKANQAQQNKALERLRVLREKAAASSEEYDAAVAAAAVAASKVARSQTALERLSHGRQDRLDAAEADVGAAKADLDKAKLRLDACEIRAPIGGAILARKAEKGDYINPRGFNVASNLCDMADLSDLEVDVKVQERDIAKISKGQPCTIQPEAYQNDAAFLKAHPNGYEGKVSRVMPVADRAQGAIPARLRVDVPAAEAGVYLRPDMGVIVSFKASKKS
ncbi:MAG TPA: efflux RND transporter periplasmic adaptor subunit [Gemmataceae bacterium]|nr:efflux RND transporter periplasmic adaptor subunit [Gemmataceae bacterium]